MHRRIKAGSDSAGASIVTNSTGMDHTENTSHKGLGSRIDPERFVYLNGIIKTHTCAQTGT